MYGKRYVAGAANSDLGVVLRDDPKDVDPKTRATVQEVYTEIWNDLAKAETYLTGKKRLMLHIFRSKM